MKIDDSIKKQLNLYIDELLKWNKKINLVSSKARENIWQDHIEDCLAFCDFLEKKEVFYPIVDIGSGGGFPIIILALYFPKGEFIATDVIQKKTSFLRWVSALLHLPLTVIDIDNRYLLKKEVTLTSRAFSDLASIIKWKEIHTPFAKDAYIMKGTKENIQKEVSLLSSDMNIEIFPLEKGNIVHLIF